MKSARGKTHTQFIRRRFCFRGGNAGGSDEAGRFKWRVKSYGMWMLFFTEDEFADFKKIQDSDYTDMPMEERFQRASMVTWVGHNETNRVTGAAVSRPSDYVNPEGETVEFFWENLYGLYNQGANVDSSVPWSETEGEFSFKEGSPKWFYVVFANFDRKCNYLCANNFACNLEYTINCYGRTYVRYNFKFLNGGPDAFSEFSYDEAGLVVFYALLFGAYTLIGIFAVGMVGLLLARDKFHQTARLLFWAVFFGWAATFLKLIHYASFGSDGYGVPKASEAGTMIYLLGDVLMLILLILCAQGWNIVRRKLALWTRVQIAVFATTYTCLTIIVYVWHKVSYDGATSSFIYDTPPGYVLLGMRCVAGAWLGAASYAQRSHFKTKAGFYRCFSMLGAVWTLSVPFIVLVAALLSDVERLKFSSGLEPTLALVVQVGLCLLFTPLKEWNPYFPFHSNVTNAASGSLSLKWRSNAGGNAPSKTDDGRSLSSVSGGRGRGVNDKGQYVIDDGFEALHIQRLKHVHRALESRLDALHTISRELNDALKVVDLDEEDLGTTRSGRPNISNRSIATPNAPPSGNRGRGGEPSSADEKREVGYEMVPRNPSAYDLGARSPTGAPEQKREPSPRRGAEPDVDDFPDRPPPLTP